MKKAWIAVAILSCAGLTLLGASPDPPSGKAVYTPSNELLRPDKYREWIYLSSGMDMSYGPMAMDHHMFTNVFVPRWAHQEFLKTGRWPQGSMFVVEERLASTGSINKSGQFQTELMGIGVEVKDEKRFPEHWAYFNFGNNKSATANPKAGCWQCHEDHAAVEHTFVQFYPTLKPIAQKYGTYRDR
jgi:Cytochrome P460